MYEAISGYASSPDNFFEVCIASLLAGTYPILLGFLKLQVYNVIVFVSLTCDSMGICAEDQAWPRDASTCLVDWKYAVI